jgi:hypothetical protein
MPGRAWRAGAVVRTSAPALRALPAIRVPVAESKRLAAECVPGGCSRRGMQGAAVGRVPHGTRAGGRPTGAGPGGA